MDTPKNQDNIFYTNVNGNIYNESEMDTNAPAANEHTYGNAEFIELADSQAGTPVKHINQENFTVNSFPCKGKGKKKDKMLFEIEDIPSWYLTIFIGMCMGKDDPDLGNIISTYLFTSGIITILQTTFGTRLPIVQGGSFAYLIPAIAILESERWKCPTINNPEDYNNEDWKVRMREIQGAILMASLFQIALGFFGVFGFIMRYITPITLASCVISIGLSLFEAATLSASTSWPISLTTIVLVIIFSQYLREVKIPIPFTKSNKRPGLLSYPMFQMFPVLLTIIVVWTLCAILTASDVFPIGHSARTDEKIHIVENAKWFRVPYPFQWGRPTFTAGAAVGFLSAVFAGIVESLSEYRAVARIVRAPKPPVHSINRGVFMEGIGCLLTGIFGTGNGTTSYCENTGAMSITKVGSRRVVQTAGFLMMIFSLIGKLGAFFMAIPEPIIGGILFVTFSMIIAIGISNLQNVNVTSSRNMFILGFTIFFSLAVSKWAGNPENAKLIDLGHPDLNFTVQILLGTGMFIAAIISFVLDNTIPGTLEERGLAPKPIEEEAEFGELDIEGDEAESVTYDLPFGMKFIRSYAFTSWIPISPTFKPSNYTGLFKRKLRTS